MSNIKTNISKIIHFLKSHFAILLIILVAVGFRTYQLDKSVWMQSGYDESRDMLVASHIVKYGEHISKGPLVAGGMNWLSNSPVYYYFIAIIWFFTREPTMFMYAWAVVMTVPVLLGYFIGKTLKDDQTGLILASLLAVNHQMIYNSRELLQPHLLLLFSLSFIWAGISFLKFRKHKLKHLILLIIFLLVPLHFHYGVLIALPIGTFWITKYWYDLNNDPKKLSYKQLLVPIFVYFGIIMSWLLLTYRVVIFDQIYFLIFNFENKYDVSFFSQLKQTVLTLSRMIWGNYLPNFFTFLFLVLTITLIKITMFGKKNKFKLNQFGKAILFIASMCSSVFFFGFYHHFVTETYFLFLFPQGFVSAENHGQSSKLFYLFS